jgi:hypothetical protein
MKTLKKVEITPLYVNTIPENLEENVLYISKEFHIAIHLCLCGCKEKAVTPLNHEDCTDKWNLIEKGEKVSLTPSIGNWIGENPFHAHYIITNNVADFV